MKTWLKPSIVSELRSFLGFCRYYRNILQIFQKLQDLCTNLLKRGRFLAGQWTAKMHLKDMKHCLTAALVLDHPDFTKPFILDTDASGTAVGAVLSQVQDDREKIVAFASRSLTKAERKYCVTTRKELLAVVHFTKYFKHYLSGKQFLVRTDHSSIQWLLSFKNP